MNRVGLIQGLIFVLVVSLAIAGVFAGEAIDSSHHDTTDNADGLHISGSADASHGPGDTFTFSKLNQIDNIPLHI